MQILVTGATGPVGRQVVARLADHPDARVRAATRDPAKLTSSQLGDRVKAVRFDFADATSVREAVSGVDRVFLLRAFGDEKQVERDHRAAWS